MNSELKGKNKQYSLKHFTADFKNSFTGLFYAYKYEQSMILHLGTCATFFILAVFFNIEVIEWAICIMVLGLIAATELINTSIEAVVDLVTKEIRPLAKVAKDTASAAVFVFSVVAFLCFLIIFVPKMIMIV